MAPDGSTVFAVSHVPNVDVSEVRAAFPECGISYEIVVSSNDAWEAMSFCATAFSKCNLQLLSARHSNSGPAIFRVGDSGQADLRELESLFASDHRHRINSWTTIIGRRRSTT